MRPLKCIFFYLVHWCVNLFIRRSHCFVFFKRLLQLKILSFEFWTVIAMIESFGWIGQVSFRPLEYDFVEIQYWILIKILQLGLLMFDLININVSIEIICDIEYIFFFSDKICMHCFRWKSFLSVSFNEGLRLNAYCISQVLVLGI